MSTSSTRVGPGAAKVYAPLPTDAQISVYARESDLQQRFETIGIVEYSNPGKYQVLTLDAALPSLREQARALGANAIILDDTQTTKSGIFSTGISVRARAVRVGMPDVAASPGPARVAARPQPAAVPPAGTSSTIELFVDNGQTFIHAGSNQGLSVGSELPIVGSKKLLGMATVMEVWPSMARVHLDESARAAPGEKRALLQSAPAAVKTPVPSGPIAAVLRLPDASQPSGGGSLSGHATLMGFGPAVGHRLYLYNDGPMPWTQCDLRLPPSGHYHLERLDPGESEAILVAKFVAAGSVDDPTQIDVTCNEGAATFNLPQS